MTGGKGDGDTVECLHLWPSVEAAQSCLIIGDGQLWPEYACGCCGIGTMGRTAAALAG